MNYERLGIIATIITVVLVLALTMSVSNNIDLGVKLPSIIAGTSTESFFDYCYRMGLDC